MIKALVLGLWASASTLAGVYGYGQYRDLRATHLAAAPTRAIETRKTKELNVPRIKDGAIKGYVVMQLSYAVDLETAKNAAIPPDPIVADEAFRYIYDEGALDFDHLDKFDLGEMTRSLAKTVNARVKCEAVVDVGVLEFTFIASAETKQRL